MMVILRKKNARRIRIPKSPAVNKREGYTFGTYTAGIINARVRACVCMWVGACLCVCMCACMYTCGCVHVHARVCACVHMHVSI